jgi:hypothetical protein
MRGAMVLVLVLKKKGKRKLSLYNVFFIPRLPFLSSEGEGSNISFFFSVRDMEFVLKILKRKKKNKRRP